MHNDTIGVQAIISALISKNYSQEVYQVDHIMPHVVESSRPHFLDIYSKLSQSQFVRCLVSQKVQLSQWLHGEV